jgi:hypothetical protein
MSSQCPYCNIPTEFRNQRFAGHLYNNHKKELLENHEKHITSHIILKRPYVKLTYKINDEQVEKWLCFASGVSCISLKWMQKHNENHKALGSAHLEMMKQLIIDKEKILTKVLKTEGNKDLLDRIAQLEEEAAYFKKETESLKKDRDEWKDMAETYRCESLYMTASIKIHNELLEDFYKREGFTDMYKAIEGYMNVAYDNSNYNEETGEYVEEIIKEGEEQARSIKYDYDMYLGERPKSKETILEEFCYDNDLDINNYRY